MLQRIINLFRFGLFKTDEETQELLLGKEAFQKTIREKKSVEFQLNLINLDIKNVDDKRSKKYKDLVKNKHICNNKLEVIEEVLEYVNDVAESVLMTTNAS